MSKELNAMLDHGEAQPVVSCTGDNGSVSYLELVIAPIYETIVKATRVWRLVIKSVFVSHGWVTRDGLLGYRIFGMVFWTTVLQPCRR
ncbi:hypothetical protein MKW92_007996 [Papaver armeniacum]|nr:hypothetical protein MKW92_007996 [Papaver armeniacum]